MILSLFNSTYVDISFKLGILFLSEIEAVFIEKCIFSFAKGKFAIIYIQNSLNLIILNSIIQNSMLSSISFCMGLKFTMIFDLIIHNNNLRSIWNDNQEVDQTFVKQIQVKSNFFSSCIYVNYGNMNSIINFDGFYIFLNIIDSFAFVSMLVGTINIEKIIINR